jgi:uncharacterized cupin superfamily protein/catechol 2,3-dioxygenase-like lactoylglutathione lyase family enzyme
MQKPLVSLDEVPFDAIEVYGIYSSRRALFSPGIGARKLGYNLTVLPPGKTRCPFHSHREEEETFLILEGEGELRFGEQRYKLRKCDVIACPTGGADVAHQIINTGSTPMRYRSLSNRSTIEVCEYLDSQKIGVFATTSPTSSLRRMFRAEAGVDYYDRESTQLADAGAQRSTPHAARQPTVPALLGVDHVPVFVEDRSAAEGWYAAVLGLMCAKALEFWASDGGPLTLQDAAGTIHIALFERPHQQTRSTITLRVSGREFQSWRAHLKSIPGLEVSQEDREVSVSLYFADPDGNPYEITSYECELARAVGGG